MKTIFIFLSILFLKGVAAQSGTLDSSFGTNGKVFSTFGDDYTICMDATLQSDGKIVTVSEGVATFPDSAAGFVIVRFLPDGSLDSSFGNGGRLVHDFGFEFATAQVVAIQGDNKIVVAGKGSRHIFGDDPNNLLMVRYNANGTLDHSFGTDGEVITEYVNVIHVNDIAIQADNKIVLTGDFSNSFFTTRYMPNGFIDNSFGAEGKVVTQFPFGVSNANAVVIQSDNKILVGGTANNKAAFARYFLNGSLDSSFGVAGTVTYSFGVSYAVIKSIALMPDGNFIAAGDAGNDGFSIDMFVARYRLNGRLDSSFGTNGNVIVRFNQVSSRTASVALQTNGKILLMGDVWNAFNSKKDNFAVSRLLENGTLDMSFGEEGQTITDLGTTLYESAAKGFLDDQGKILIAGRPGNYNPPLGNAILLVRYNGDTVLTEKYVRIKKWLHRHGITWEDKPNNLINYYSIQSSTNGNAFTEVARIFSNHIGGIQTYSASNNATANYRVAAVSNTGNITYSNTLTLVNTTPTIQLYPNPAKNNLQIQGLPAGTAKLTVTDITGNTRIIASAYSTVYSINIAHLTSGNYLLNIKTANEVITKQFIKE